MNKNNKIINNEYFVYLPVLYYYYNQASLSNSLSDNFLKYLFPYLSPSQYYFLIKYSHIP